MPQPTGSPMSCLPLRLWCFNNSPSVRVVLLLAVGAAVAIATGEWVRSGEGLVLQPEGPLWRRLLSYCLLAVVSALVVAYDYKQLGPTLALSHGTSAAAAAWFFAVPLGMLSGILIRCAWVMLFCSVAGLFAYMAYGAEEDQAIRAMCILFSIGSVCLAFNGPMLYLATHDLGCVIIFLAAYVFVRLLLRERTASSGMASLIDLEGVDEVSKDSEEFHTIKDNFELACVARADKYQHWLRVERVYRKRSSSSRLERTFEGQRLFHGTSWESAQGIVSDGFRLPSHAGMFGRGIYFADCPLKSWWYTDSRAWRPGVILYCWVELGNAKHAKGALPALSQPPSRSFWEWIRGTRRYDSVVGDDQSVGGALRVPEYIVYNPARVEVDYILEVWSVLKGTPPE